MSGDQDILGAFRAAVNETMHEIEAEMKTRVRIGRQDRDRTTGNKRRVRAAGVDLGRWGEPHSRKVSRIRQAFRAIGLERGFRCGGGRHRRRKGDGGVSAAGLTF